MTIARPVVALDEFLVAHELMQIEGFLAEAATTFEPARVVPPAALEGEVLTERRSALFRKAPKAIAELFRLRLFFHLPFVQGVLGYPPFQPQMVETQITASNEGDFFRRHNDDVDAAIPTRELTYVYYCHRCPRQFEHGELLLYPPAAGASRAVIMAPVRNRILLFPSFLTHEVTMVRCRSKRFQDGRITINGWIHGPQGGKDVRQAAWLAKLGAPKAAVETTPGV